MSITAQLLRDAAAAIPKTKAEKLRRRVSAYICDTVGTRDAYTVEQRTVALKFLGELGMGGGFYEFSPAFMSDLSTPAYSAAQSRRIAWLLFAAALADEWNA